MANKFTGDLDELKALVAKTGIKGTWEVKDNGHHQYRTRDSAQLNWWETKGTLNFTGQADAKERLRLAMEKVFAAPEATASVPRRATKQPTIFVVHGHDAGARDQLELALHRLGLKPFILMNSSGAARRSSKRWKGTSAGTTPLTSASR